MNITRILPRPLAKSFQKYDLAKKEAYLQYYEGMARVYRELVEEGREELNRLEGT